jgi:hypothetical protein
LAHLAWAGYGYFCTASGISSFLVGNQEGGFSMYKAMAIRATRNAVEEQKRRDRERKHLAELAMQGKQRSSTKRRGVESPTELSMTMAATS